MNEQATTASNQHRLSSRKQGRHWRIGIALCAFLWGGASSAEPLASWISTWATAPASMTPFDAPTPAFNDVTLRQIVRVSLGGRSVRVWFTNEFGTEPLEIGAATLAKRNVDDRVAPGSLRTLTFGGEPAITIAPGARVASDPVVLRVAQRTELAISTYLPQDLSAGTSPNSYHVRALQTSFHAPGNQTSDVRLSGPSLSTEWHYLAAVDVLTNGQPRVIATFGDSITDGDQLASAPPVDLNHRYSDFLGDILFGVRRAAVVNLGITGNQLTATFLGENMQARLTRDVLGQTGVTHAIVLGGINDLGLPVLLGAPSGASVASLIAGHQQIAARLRAAGIVAIGGTITPSGSFPLPGYNTPETDARRNAVNDWLRTSDAYDMVIDFDAELRDPQDPTVLRADLTADGLHPNSAGYRVMAQAIARALRRNGF